jgi:hypothetical protein
MESTTNLRRIGRLPSSVRACSVARSPASLCARGWERGPASFTVLTRTETSVQQILIKFCECLAGQSCGIGAIQHCDQEDSPADDAQDGDQVDQVYKALSKRIDSCGGPRYDRWVGYPFGTYLWPHPIPINPNSSNFAIDCNSHNPGLGASLTLQIVDNPFTYFVPAISPGKHPVRRRHWEDPLLHFASGLQRRRGVTGTSIR